jgi:hypothetical protein
MSKESAVEKAIIVIGEGKSERAFFKSLLQNQYGYIASCKSDDCLEYDKTLVLFAHPSMGEAHK